MEQVLSCKSNARIFHLGYLLLLDELDKEDPEYGVAAARALDGLQKQGYETSVDVVSEEGDRYRKVILPCLKYTDYLIINEVEAENCLGIALRKDGKVRLTEAEEAARQLLDLGVGKMVVIHFPEGGVVATKDRRSCSAPSFSPSREEIVSTVGAGDAFCAGSLYGIYKGYTDREILEFGSMCAAVSLRVPDAVSGLTDEKGIRDFCKNLSRKFLEIR